LKFKKSGKLQA